MRGTICFLCVTLALTSSPLSARAQVSERKLGVSRYEREPLQIEKTNCDPSDQYFGTLSLVVLNATDKPVYYAEYVLTFSDFKIGEKQVVLTLCYGDEAISRTNKPGDGDKPLKPTKTATLKIANGASKMMVDRLAAVGHRTAGVSAVLKLRTVCFGDGTRLQDGKVVTDEVSQR